MQDSFAKVLERWRRSENPGAYLRRCVVNGCRDQHRRQALERRLRPKPPPSAALGADEVDALAGLNTQRRAVVVLRYYDGLTREEIAAVPDRVTTTNTHGHASSFPHDRLIWLKGR